MFRSCQREERPDRKNQVENSPTTWASHASKLITVLTSDECRRLWVWQNNSIISSSVVTIAVKQEIRAG